MSNHTTDLLTVLQERVIGQSLSHCPQGVHQSIYCSSSRSCCEEGGYGPDLEHHSGAGHLDSGGSCSQEGEGAAGKVYAAATTLRSLECAVNITTTVKQRIVAERITEPNVSNGPKCAFENRLHSTSNRSLRPASFLGLMNFIINKCLSPILTELIEK